MQARELIGLIEHTADPRLAADWDTSGVQIAGTRENCTRLACTLDPRPAILAEAIAWGADFILTHHPLTLKPRLPDRLDDYHEALRLVLGQGAWLYAAHTTLDAAPAGPAGWLAEALGMENTCLLDPTGQIAPDTTFGYGRIGELPAPLPFAELTRRIAELAGRPFLTLAGDPPLTVTTLAYCPGSGADLAQRAFALGAEVYLTGDVKYHQAAAVPAGRCLVDVGHFALEEAMLAAFARDLTPALRQQGLTVRYFSGNDPFSVHFPDGASSRIPE